MFSEQMQTIFEIGLVPLVVLEDVADAVPLGKALVRGGIPVAEVTFRTDACLAVIRAMKQVQGLIVGAGTVHNIKQAAAAVEAGATFIVTPAYNPAVVQYCLENHIDILPGTVSPAEIEAAQGLGIEACKFFPAAAYGGPITLKALGGPFGKMKFVPTGGVSLANMRDYLALSNVAAIGGSFMTPATMVHSQDWEGIVRTCRQAVHTMLGLHIGHIGIHAQGNIEAENFADELCQLTGEEKICTDGGFFAGTFAEICAQPTPGEKGHICLDTTDMPRALAYFKRRGTKFNEQYTFRNEKGAIRLAYLKETVGGFSIHLRRAE